MARERQRREDRNQSLGNCASRPEPIETWCLDSVEVVVPEPVERDEDDIVAVDDLWMIDAAGSLGRSHRGEVLRRCSLTTSAAGDDDRDECEE